MPLASLQELVYYILTQDRDSAMTDALRVVGLYSNLDHVLVYDFRLRQLVNSNKVLNKRGKCTYAGNIMLIHRQVFMYCISCCLGKIACLAYVLNFLCVLNFFIIIIMNYYAFYLFF